MLLDKFGFSFTTNRKNKTGKIYWTCCECDRIKRKNMQEKKEKKEKKNARAITDGIHVIQWNGEHNHPLNEKTFFNPK